MKNALKILFAVVLCMTLFVGPAYAEAETNLDEATIEYDLDVIAEMITEAYGGATDLGEYVGFGANEDGSYSILFFFTSEEHVTFVGPAVIDGNMVTIEDAVNGLTVGFEVLEASEEGIVLDFGDIGTATLDAISVESLIDGLHAVLTNTATVESVVGAE